MFCEGGNVCYGSLKQIQRQARVAPEPEARKCVCMEKTMFSAPIGQLLFYVATILAHEEVDQFSYSRPCGLFKFHQN